MCPFSSGASSTHSMTSPTVSIISTEHVDKSIEGATDGSTGTSETTKSSTDSQTLPDHDNMHAGTVDTATTPERRTTPTDGKISLLFIFRNNYYLFLKILNFVYNRKISLM